MIENRCESFNGEVYLLMAEKTWIWGLFYNSFLSQFFKRDYILLFFGKYSIKINWCYWLTGLAVEYPTNSI